VPYFQEGCSPAEIIRWIPVLKAEEIAVALAYYRDRQAELDEQDRQIRNALCDAGIRQRSKRSFVAAPRKWQRYGNNLPKSMRRSVTVIALLADANIQGQVELLAARMQGEPWREFWDYLQLRCLRFSDAGLDPADSDAVVWRRSQDLGMLLLTDNRNDEGPDSLEYTIRTHNTVASLPVLTIGDVRSVSTSGNYANRVIERLLQYLLELESIRGTGR
jgi:hypothetical protein